MANDLVSSLQSLAKEKLAIFHREKQLVDALNRVLPAMGYRIVSTAGSNGGNDAGSVIRRSAPRRSLACPQCGRRFGHPLHLGRHVSAMHKMNGQRRTPVQAKTRKRVPTGPRTKRGAKKAA
jgi:hypothetical protein